MARTILFVLLIQSSVSRCIARRCQTFNNCTKDPHNQHELTQTENGSVMYVQSIKRPYKSWEYKWQRNNTTRQRSSSSPRRYQHLYCRTLQSKTRSDFCRCKLTRRHLGPKADENVQNLTSPPWNKWPAKWIKSNTITQKISTW